MPKIKKMDEGAFADKVDELNATGEMIRTKQEEKQAVMNEFEREKSRKKKGDISEKTLETSVKMTNEELSKIDKDIKKEVEKVEKTATIVKKIVEKQKPSKFKATESGVKSTKR